MKISVLIKHLKSIKEQCGNVSCYLSSDAEGNSFGTIEDDSFSFDKAKVVIFPCREHCDLSWDDEDAISDDDNKKTCPLCSNEFTETNPGYPIRSKTGVVGICSDCSIREYNHDN